MAVCFSCAAQLDRENTTGRGAECTECGADVKVCKNCRFYDTGAYNDCAEPNAERVVEKERANFCDYFTLAKNDPDGSSSFSKEKPDPMAELKKLLGDK
jgi:hypothetical protein